MSVVSVIKHVTHMSGPVICALSGSTSFPTLTQKTARFWGTIIEHKMCFLISSTTFV